MKQVVDQFLHQLAADGTVPHNTLTAYRTDLLQFATFLRDHAATSVVTLESMQAFCSWLYDQDYAAATIARRITALRALGAFLVQTGMLPSNPGDQLRPPLRTRTIPHLLTPMQLQALCAQPLGEEAPESWRDCAMLHLLTATTLRVSDLLALNLDHVALETGMLRLPDTRGDGQPILLPPLVVMALATYLTLGRPRLLGDNAAEVALFVNQRGQRLTRQGCWGIIKKHAQRLALDDVTPERLRQAALAHQHRGAGLAARRLALPTIV